VGFQLNKQTLAAHSLLFFLMEFHIFYESKPIITVSTFHLTNCHKRTSLDDVRNNKTWN